MKGKVYLVGAGPGDPELLTLKALRILKTANVVLHDDLVGSEILAFAPHSAEIRNVGKRGGKASAKQSEINQLLVNYALLGLQVVRLKGGDPLVFGRAGEEVKALRQAAIEFEIVPGITAALGVAAGYQIPLTHRDLASSLLVLSGHEASSKAGASSSHWPQQIPAATTVLVYMPGYDYQNTSRKLITAGLTPDTPCAVVSHATCFDEQTHMTTLGNLHLTPPMPSPTLLVVGEVVSLSRRPQRSGTAGSYLSDLELFASPPNVLPPPRAFSSQEESK